MLIIPGTKNSIEDALWIKKSGWEKKIKEFARKGKIVFGICGGFQILGKSIKDPYGVESEKGEVKGIGLLPIRTVIFKEKTVRKVKGRCLLNRRKIEGYEIHMGRTEAIEEKGMPFSKLRSDGESWFDGWILGNVMGTYVHGIMDSAGIREDILNRIRLKKGLKPKKRRINRMLRFREYERLADIFEKYCNMRKILEII